MANSIRSRILVFTQRILKIIIQLLSKFFSFFPVLKNISIEIIIDKLRANRGIVLAQEVDGLVSLTLEAQSKKIYSDSVAEFNSQFSKTLTVLIHNGQVDGAISKLKSKISDSGLAVELVASTVCTHDQNVENKKEQTSNWLVDVLTNQNFWESVVFIRANRYSFFEISDIKRLHIENLSSLKSFVTSFRVVPSPTNQTSHDCEVFKTLDAKYIDSRMWGFSRRFFDYFDMESNELRGTTTKVISEISLKLLDFGIPIRQVPIQVNEHLIHDLRLDVGCEYCWQSLANVHNDLRVLRRQVLPAKKLPPVNISIPKSREKKRLLFVQPISGGGLPATTAKLANGLENDFEIYTLVCQQSRFQLFKGSSQSEQLIDFDLRQVVEPLSHRSSDYDYLFSVVVGLLNIDIVQVEHLVWQSLGIAEICNYFNVPLFYTFHDYYAVCASHNLLDENLKFCGGHCTKGSGFCQVSLWPKYDLADLKNGTVYRWQKQMGLFLDFTHAIFAPSSATANDAIEIFPRIKDKIVIAPHSTSVAFDLVTPKYVIPGQILKILVIGDLGPHKGEYQIRKLADQAEEIGVEIHILGPGRGLLQRNIVNHGEYKVIDLAEKIREIEPNIAFLPSITHETFSHALTELLSLGLPVVAFSGSGAVEDRIISDGVGLIIDPDQEPRLWINQIKNAFFDGNFKKIYENIVLWQRTNSNTTPGSTAFYLDSLY